MVDPELANRGVIQIQQEEVVIPATAVGSHVFERYSVSLSPEPPMSDPNAAAAAALLMDRGKPRRLVRESHSFRYLTLTRRPMVNTCLVPAPLIHRGKD